MNWYSNSEIVWHIGSNKERVKLRFRLIKYLFIFFDKLILKMRHSEINCSTDLAHLLLSIKDLIQKLTFYFEKFE